MTAHSSNYHFFAGESAQAAIFQNIDVSDYADAIDEGEQAFTFEVYVRSYAGFAVTDSASAFVYYWDGEDIDNPLALFESEEYFSTEDWTLIEDTRVAPAGTRVISVLLVSLRHGGFDNDGYFDDVSLIAINADAVRYVSMK